MKKIIIITLSIITLNCNQIFAQKLSLQPFVGTSSFRFIGNGTCQQTSIGYSFSDFNNPYINKINLGLALGVDLMLHLSKRRSISLIGQLNRIPYNININRSYSSTGYWRATTGYLQANYVTPQFYVCYNEQVYKKNKLQIFSTLGATFLSNPNFKLKRTSQTLYNGEVLNAEYEDNTPKTFIKDLYSKGFCVRLGIKTFYNNFSFNLFLDQGLKNAFSGLYKASHNDGQQFNIFSQSVTATIGYKLTKKTKSNE